MLKVYSLPTPEEAAQDTSNAINQIVLKLAKHLPAYGVEIVSNRDESDLIVGHAGQTDGKTPVDVAHCHGLYPTQQFPDFEWHWAANEHVIRNLRQAKAITVPSQWVADILRRDMHVEPHVVGWAIEPDDWKVNPKHTGEIPGAGGYVLWNKTRVDRVCDPTPLNELAKRVRDMTFISTFGDKQENTRIIGRQPYEAMQAYVHNAALYLATTKETFGIATLEAMACGIPILGYNWGGTADIVEHERTGWLVKPGDIDGLAEGLRYCLKNHHLMSGNARQVAEKYTWDKVAAAFADIYHQVARPHAGPKVSVVIPCHNYARWVGEAINSVKGQQANFDFELIVVDDGSKDDSFDVVMRALGDWKPPRAQHVGFPQARGPAWARNHGISLAHGEYIVCLDADDELGSPHFLQTLADALDANRELGIVFTGLLPIDDENRILPPSGWPNGYNFERQLQKSNQVPTCCMFRREAWKRAGGYRSRFIPAEDAELWTRMGALGYRAAQIVGEPWFVYRMHPNSLSAQVRSRASREPNWLTHMPWAQTEDRPFAADGRPPRRSWAVRNYDQPLISVVIPVGPGHEAYLPEALDTVEAQTEWRWECIVVNDSGTPLQMDAYPWVRTILCDARNAGAARNLGVRGAKGKFVAFLDADDWWNPTFLEKTLRAFRRTGRYAYTDWISLSKDGLAESHETPDYNPSIIFEQTSIHSICVLIPRADVLSVGGFAEDMTAWEDVDFYMRLAAAGFCGVRVPEPLMTYRYRTGSLRERGETRKQELLDYLRKHYGDYIERRKDVCCNDGVRVKVQAVAPPQMGDNGDMVRVSYTGPDAPAAQQVLVGPATKAQYGRRAAGDVFLVWRADFEAMPRHFEPYQEFDVAEV